MTIELAVIGKTGQSFVEEGLSMYTKRIKRYVGFTVKEIKTGKLSGKLSPGEIMEKEGQQLLKQVADKDSYLVLLDDKGKTYTSVKFASFLQNKMLTGQKKLIFAVGGAYGFSETVKQQADFSLSLSRMTFSHQIVRVIFAEQLYRAFTIINNEPYHNQ